MPQPNINLKKFCASRDSFRPESWQKPFVRDGKKCATDGKIVVAIPANGLRNTKGKFPDVRAVLPKSRVQWTPFPKRRKYEAESDSGIECLHIGGRYIQKQYAELIGSLPGAFYYSKPTPVAHHGTHLTALWFKFDGGVGAVMPYVFHPMRNPR